MEIPKEIREQLDITKKEKKDFYDVAVLVEHHQVKIPLPKNIRLKLKLEKGARCKIFYDHKNKEVRCKFQ